MSVKKSDATRASLISVYRMAAGGSPSMDPKLPWPSISGTSMVNGCASRTAAS